MSAVMVDGSGHRGPISDGCDPSVRVPSRRRSSVLVVGQGLAGLAQSAHALDAGHVVTILDPDPAFIRQLTSGRPCHPDRDVAATLRDAWRNGRLIPMAHCHATAVPGIVIITAMVAPPGGPSADELLLSATRSLAPHLRHGAHVILDPGLPPGPTCHAVVRTLETGSGLRAGRGFIVARRAHGRAPTSPVRDVPPATMPRTAVPAPRPSPPVSRPAGRRGSATAGAVTTLTVLVPACNEEDGIAATIEALLGQVAPDWLRITSIIVVVNNSTDRTAEIAREYPVTVVEMLRNPHKKAGALNHAWTRYTEDCEVVLTMDADTVLRPDTVAKMAEELRNNPVLGGVCARYWVTPGRGLLWRLQRLEYTRYDDLRELRGWRVSVASGAAAMYRQTALSQVAESRDRREPWDDQSLIEDYALTLDLKARGWRVGAAREAHVFTTPPATLRALWHQRLRWGRGGMDECLKRGWIPTTRSDVLAYGLFAMSVFFRILFITMVALILIYDLPMRYALVGLIPVAVMWVERVTSAWRLPDKTWRDAAVVVVLVIEDLYGFFLEICAVVAAWRCLSGQRGKRQKW